MNKNDNPLNSISDVKPVIFNDFEYKDYFKKIFTLYPDVENEKLDIMNSEEETANKRGLVYCFVIDGILLKIGSSTTSMKARIQSYNCGKESYRENGTCSTTNFFILQTFLNIGKEVDVYAYFPETILFDVFGKKEESSLPAKKYEKTILENLKKNNMFPSLCSQT